MKKFLALLLALAMVFSLAACGGTGEPAEDSGSEDAAASEGGTIAVEDLKIGILIPGSPTDGGFSQRAVEAAAYLEEVFPGCTTSVVQAATAEEIKQEGSNFADDGYQIVFGHGGQCSAPFDEICGDYPDVWFATMGGECREANLFEINMCYEQVTYIAGVAAALTSDTNTIAWQTGGDYASYTKTTNALEMGAKSVNPDIKVLSQVLSATDPTVGYETALSQINEGASFVMSNSNEAQSGAIKAAAEQGAYTMGCIGNFTDQAPDSLIMNTYCEYAPAYEMAVQAVLDGDVPEQLDVTPQNAPEALFWEWNDQVKDTLDPEVVEKVEAEWEKMLNGEIHVPDEFEYAASLN